MSSTFSRFSLHQLTVLGQTAQPEYKLSAHDLALQKQFEQYCADNLKAREESRPAAQRLAMGDQVARDRALGFKL